MKTFSYLTHTHLQQTTDLYVCVDEVLSAAPVDPFPSCDLPLLWYCPARFLSVTVEPHQNLTIGLHTAPAAHLSKLWH